MSGTWVFVCGPSGAGKDSVIAWACDHLVVHSHFVFAQRMVTRVTPFGAQHQGVHRLQFERLLESGGLAWNWQAHGLHYGICSRYARQVAWGRVVVVNGSREHVAALPPRPCVRVVHVVADARQLAVRLAGRGRDAPVAIAQRLARNERFHQVAADVVIENGGEIATAGLHLADFLLLQAASANEIHV